MCLTLCYFVLVCFSALLALRLPRLGKRANLSVFRTFVRFVLDCFCLCPLPLDVWKGLRFVIVALPGLFSYPFLLDSPELLQILVTLTVVIKPLLPNFLGRAIVILNFMRFRNFIADTVPC